MKFIKAAIFILFIPAILQLMSVLQDYVDINLTLTTLQGAVFSLFPFVFVGLCILGLFMAFRRRSSGDE